MSSAVCFHASIFVSCASAIVGKMLWCVSRCRHSLICCASDRTSPHWSSVVCCFRNLLSFRHCRHFGRFVMSRRCDHLARDCLLWQSSRASCSELYTRVPVMGEVHLGASLELFFWEQLHVVHGLSPESIQEVPEKWGGDSIRLPHVCGEWIDLFLPVLCRYVGMLYEYACHPCARIHVMGMFQQQFNCCFMRLTVVVIPPVDKEGRFQHTSGSRNRAKNIYLEYLINYQRIFIKYTQKK